jgi:hypothetical protein
MAVKSHGRAVETGGQDGSWRVAKRSLIPTFQVLLQTGRLRLPEELALGAVLRDGPWNFRVKVNTPRPTTRMRCGGRANTTIWSWPRLWRPENTPRLSTRSYR